jgi:hypothetical protein
MTPRKAVAHSSETLVRYVTGYVLTLLWGKQLYFTKREFADANLIVERLSEDVSG